MQQWLNPAWCPLHPCSQQTSSLWLHRLQNWRRNDTDLKCCFWGRKQGHRNTEVIALALGTGSTFLTPPLLPTWQFWGGGCL